MRILLVDDHALFRDGLRLLLGKINQKHEVVEVSEGAEALKILQSDKKFDLLLLDYQLGDMCGMAVLDAVKSSTPDLPVIILSGHKKAELIKETLSKGVNGYIPKSSSPEVILSAINLVTCGGCYIPPDILEETKIDDASASYSPSEVSKFLSPRLKTPQYPMTQRQMEVMTLMGYGLSNKEIARKLNMSPSTVKVHVSAIFKVLEAKNRTVAVSRAKELRLIASSGECMTRHSA